MDELKEERLMDWVVAWRVEVNAENVRSTATKLLEIMAIPNFTTAYFALVDENGEVHEVDLKKMAEELD